MSRQGDAKSLQLNFKAEPAERKNFSLELDISIATQGVTALFGPSGSGKTSLLRAIAGLDKPSNGRIHFDQQVWQDETSFLPAYRRPIGYVFQESSLFEHLSAADNLHFAIQRAKPTSTHIHYQQVIELMQIGPLLAQFPQQLSGGERQRVAIARALLIQPQLLLMDEPLSALDDALKQEILPYLENLCHQAHIPIIYVSHALDEVIRLTDNMVVLEKGRVTEQGSTPHLLAKLGTSFCHYQDASVVIQGRVSQQHTQWGLSVLSLEGQELYFKSAKAQLGEQVKLRIQAKDVSLALSAHTDTSILNRLAVTVDQLATESQDSSMITVRLLAGSTPILARITSLSAHHLQLRQGMSLYAQIKSVAVIA